METWPRKWARLEVEWDKFQLLLKVRDRLRRRKCFICRFARGETLNKLAFFISLLYIWWKLKFTESTVWIGYTYIYPNLRVSTISQNGLLCYTDGASVVHFRLRNLLKTGLFSLTTIWWTTLENFKENSCSIFMKSVYKHGGRKFYLYGISDKFLKKSLFFHSRW